MPESHGPPWGRRRGPWGPQGGPRPSRQLFRRVIGFVLFLILIAAAGGAVIATGLAAVGGAGRWLIVIIAVAGVTLVALLARRMLGRTWRPIGDLIDATRRLGEGEQGVRLDFPGPGPFVPVSRSFNKMAERLEEEDRRRRRLLADIGHELRTPMTVIRGQVEAVIDGLHERGDLFNVIDEIDLMDRLLDDLRLLGLAESGTLRLETAATDLADLARGVVASFSNMADSKEVEVVVTEDGAGQVDVDPHRIHQVISNLVANALRQMPHGGRLEIGVSTGVDSAVITVADTGSGITGDFDRVFERFVRSADSTGTGLGLSISRDLVDAHGGTLTAANRRGGGALFTVTLPRLG